MRRIAVLGIIAAAAATFGVARRAEATRYIFSTFSGDDAAGMKLSIYTSTDSLNFTLLSNTGFGGNTGYIRDPSIMKYSDGKYYVAYTDPTTASCCNPEDHFGIAVSSDLITWTDLTTVKAGVTGVSRTWAPEWYVEGDVIAIIANIDTGSELPNFQPYVFTAQNSALTAWSGPTALGIGTDYIDTFVAKLGSTYHAFVKNDDTRYLEHATATSLTGPWTFVGTGDWAGWGSGMEGPAIVQLDDGTFRMYVDPQAGGVPCQTMTSTDLNKWSARSSIPGTAGTIVRHGTVIRDVTGLGSNGYLTAAGGSTSVGGSAATGGSKSTGGTASTAGASGIAGSTSTGGTKATGATGATGGEKPSGGATSTGGLFGIGGTLMVTGGTKSASGGTAAAGTSNATDGAALATGGAISAGGLAGTGGNVAATGGLGNTSSGAMTGGVQASGGATHAGGLAPGAGATGLELAGTSATGTSQSSVPGSCSCRAAGKPSRSAGLPSFALLGLALLRQRRRHCR